MAKVTKKVAKKSLTKTAKKAPKKVITPEQRAMNAEIKKMEAAQKKAEKVIVTHQKNTESFGKEVAALAKKYDFKVILQGFDMKADAPFVQGFGVKNGLESAGMVDLLRNSFKA